MRRLLRFRFLVFVLLLAVGVGSVFSVVQAGQMRVDMSMAGDAQDPDANACTACGTGDDGAKAPVNCAAACHLAAVDTVDAVTVSGPIDIQAFRMDRTRSARPAIPLIDPSPPKPILG